MNKTITVNISGLVFNIEEEAYRVLTDYLNAVRTSLDDSATAREVMDDVEARIAELFQSRLDEQKQVIVMADVEEVIGIMGEPKDYRIGADDEDFEGAEGASGSRQRRRRIFRNPDDQIIGGVCGGLAAYFNVDTLWIRLIWILLFIVGGTGLLLYLILWAIIPEARTTAEKLEMTGEEINVENIKKRVHEEKENLNDSFRRFKRKLNGGGSGLSQGINHVFGLLIQLLEMVLKLAVKVLGIAAILLGGFIFLCLVLSLATSGLVAPWFNEEAEFSLSILEWASLMFQSQVDIWLLLAFAVLCIIATSSMFVYAGTRALGISRKPFRGFGLSLLIIWFVSLVSVGIIIGQTVTEFSDTGTYTEDVAVESPSDTLYLKATNDLYFSNYVSRHHDKYLELLEVEDDRIYSGRVLFDILPARGTETEIRLVRKSDGFNEREALDRARRIDYHFSQQDSLLLFDPYYAFPLDDHLRKQFIRVEMRIPVGKTVYLDQNMDRIIYDIRNVNRYYDGDMVGRYWVMRSEGLSLSEPHRDANTQAGSDE